MKRDPKSDRVVKNKAKKSVKNRQNLTIIKMIREVELAFMLGKQYSSRDRQILKQELISLTQMIENAN